MFIKILKLLINIPPQLNKNSYYDKLLQCIFKNIGIREEHLIL